MTSEELLKYGSSKLNKAVEKGDLKRAGEAQMMIDTATSKIEKLRREVDKVGESQKQVEKEKTKECKSRSSTVMKEKKYRQGKCTIIEQEENH